MCLQSVSKHFPLEGYTRIHMEAAEFVSLGFTFLGIYLHPCPDITLLFNKDGWFLRSVLLQSFIKIDLLFMQVLGWYS